MSQISKLFDIINEFNIKAYSCTELIAYTQGATSEQINTKYTQEGSVVHLLASLSHLYQPLQEFCVYLKNNFTIDLDNENYEDNTPFDCAIDHVNLDFLILFGYFEKYGFDYVAPDNHNPILFNLLANINESYDWQKGWEIKVIKFFFENKANLAFITSENRNALHYCFHYESIDILLKAGCDLNLVPILYETTPFMSIVDNFSPIYMDNNDLEKTLILCLEHGANPYLQNYNGKNIFDMLEKKSLPNLIDFIHNFEEKKHLSLILEEAETKQAVKKI